MIIYNTILKLIHSQTEDLSHHGKNNLLKKSRTSSTSSPSTGSPVDISETVSFTKTQSIFYRSTATQTTLTLLDMSKMMEKIKLLDELNCNIQKIDKVFSSKLQCTVLRQTLTHFNSAQNLKMCHFWRANFQLHFSEIFRSKN